jgi:CheY-like chemotaxis protein
MMASVPPRHDRPLLPPSASPQRKRRILLVEDSRDAAESIKMTLQEHYFVDVQLDPVKAFTFYKPRFYDLILVDYKMPNMDGYQFCQNIRRIDATVKVCLITAYEDIGSRIHQPDSHGQMPYTMGEEPAVPILKKPFDRATLLATISSILEQ